MGTAISTVFALQAIRCLKGNLKAKFPGVALLVTSSEIKMTTSLKGRSKTK
jgi:hypothetical protein